ncbi:MAG: Bacitracin export permease protein BceB [Firmicutes bacterium ADurb.Bin248]|nr:MAG: Bacitracin export permease protein BceB [Firmicutes bacterium ADurb.Bin248]HOG00168.1 ABC transporter permease [Clostridia bacterium]HPK16191.1 ABC transporter permease [Clostridia bacterium]
MRKGLYARLALANFKNHRRLYLPYLLSCAGSAAMFYMIFFLATSSALLTMRGGGSLASVLAFGCAVIAVFSSIIVLYANSFIMKRRKRELGLYNILGMEKKHIARLMATETVYAALASIALGIASGILFSKLLLLLICKMLRFEVPFGFEVSALGVIATLLLFGGIFFLALIWNVSRVHVAKPIELLSAANVGEREPKTRWFLALTGALALGGGYALAVSVKQPAAAILAFFLAVILVIAGTYCLFTAGSVAFLKNLRKRKGYYYRTRNFISVSSMIYRMKQNAVGLANICILSTMVLVTLSTTICLYYGLEDSLRNMYPRNVEIHAGSLDDGKRDEILSIAANALEETGIKPANTLYYRSAILWCARNGDAFSPYTGMSDAHQVCLIPLEDYNQMAGARAQLAPGEAFVYCADASLPGAAAAFGDVRYRIVDALDVPPVRENWYMVYGEEAVWYFILPDMEDLEAVQTALSGEDDAYGGYSMYYGFDVDGAAEERTLAETLEPALDEYVYSFPEGEGFYLNFGYTDESRVDYYATYGGLFFLGIFLGLMFTCAAALIMYYKQISEGYDDRGRFDIMQKVGLSRAEVRASVRAQVLTVFFLPLAAAGVHVAFAFPLIATLFKVLALTNVKLFLLCTLGCYAAFAALYAAVYALTARTYYKIVSDD